MTTADATPGHADSPRLAATAIAAALGRPEPTPEQIAVIEADPGPLLVIAGAGSGKTETMAARVVWLVANNLVAPGQVLGLTFTRKAAGELSERIGGRLRALVRSGVWHPPGDGALDGILDLPTVTTYHGYAGRLVGEHALRLGREPDTRLLTEAACWQRAARIVESWQGDVTGLDKALSTITEAVVALSGELNEHLVEPEDAGRWIDDFLAELERPREPGRLRKSPVAELVASLRERRLILPMVAAYRAANRDGDAMDFSDHMALAARLATSFPDIGATERERYTAVFLDEFQDTSDAQTALLQALFAGPEGAGTVVAVGDPHQAIYGWRGASTTTLARFPQVFAGASGRSAPTLPLSTSWRNDTLILTVANTLAGPLREGAARRGVPVAALTARPGAADGEVTVARCPTIDDEAALIAQWLAARWRSPSGRRRLVDGRPVTAAVLCRKRAQFPVLVRALRAAGLPVEVVGLGGLLWVPEVVDIVALLTVAHDPSRGDQLMRLLTGPVCRLGAADIDGLWEWARALSRRPDDAPAVPPDLDRAALDAVTIVEALDRLPEPGWAASSGARIGPVALARLRRLAGIVDTMRRLVGGALGELVVHAERALGLDVELLARPGVSPGVARTHVDALVEVAEGFAATTDRPTLGAFLAWLDAARERENGLDLPEVEPDTDAVQLLTIHAAKGLEWDAVAIPGLVEGTLPVLGGGEVEDGADEPVFRAPSDKGWMIGLSGLPYPLRRDADGLPQFDIADVRDLPTLRQRFQETCQAIGEHELREERRLAYVAVTRARHDVLLAAAIWGDGKKPRVSSRFLHEVLTAHDGVDDRWLQRLEWQPLAGPDDTNPRTDNRPIGRWPTAPLPADHELRRAADRVRAALPGDQPAVADGGSAARWRQEAETLLAERAARLAPSPPPQPSHLSASALVALAADPGALAADLRRPMPRPPADGARRGTAFHTWVEEHYRRAAMVDLAAMPGSADDNDDIDTELPRMKELFAASEWADRIPLDIECAVETVIAGVAVRARIDAVFPDVGPDGLAGAIVVDWKTGIEPTGRQAEVRALQLGVYALAWSRLTGSGMPVRAAFYYARTGRTVWVEVPGEDRLVEALAGWPTA